MKAKEFNIFDMVSGASYPKDSVTIYFDLASAYEITQIDRKIDSPARFGFDDETLASMEEKRKELRKKMAESAVTVEMRGVPDFKVQALRKKLNKEFGLDELVSGDIPPEFLHKWQVSLLQLSLVKATSADGQEQDLQDQDYDIIDTWFAGLPVESQKRLDDLVARLSLATDYFEKAEVTTDF